MRLADLLTGQICILGFGREGRSALAALRRLKPDIAPIVADSNAIDDAPNCTIVTGADYLEKVAELKPKVIVKSPGIPPHPIIETWRKNEQITSATELFFTEAQAAGATVIGITGSKGKSTTTTLIFELLKAGNIDAHLVGNIGRPSLDDLPLAKPGTVFVHELSSYQLADSAIRPNIAVVTAFFPEHLDYHGSLQAYWQAKARICEFQTGHDVVVYNAAFPECKKIADLSPGGKVAITQADAPVSLDEIKLKGAHNLGNIALAVTVAKMFEVPEEKQLGTIKNFTGLPHRLQSLGVTAGIEWIDDAISTTPDSAIAALDALGDRVQTIILGGQDRGLDFSKLGERLKNSAVKIAILFPGSGPRIRLAIEQAGAAIELFDAPTMEDAVTIAFTRTPHTTPAAICLLSTASPSYGMFKNFEHKGDEFQRIVKKCGSF